MKNEADTRVLLVEPLLKKANWTSTQIVREYAYTAGTVERIGETFRRGPARKVDMLLRYADTFPLAVVEAKAESQPADSGLEQAKSYAQDLRLDFTYATNGHQIVEYDLFLHKSQELDRFPTPQELWEKWTERRNIPPCVQPLKPYHDKRNTHPLLHPYCAKEKTDKTTFYFQEIAIREVLIRIMRGQKRILLTMAMGTGKTFTALQITWKLIKSQWLARQHPDRPARILFLADREALCNQAYNALAPLADTSEPQWNIEKPTLNLSRYLYFAIYRTLWSSQGDQRFFEKIPRDFFDLIFIDECHRSDFGTRKEILEHFESAIHLGKTVTPNKMTT